MTSGSFRRVWRLAPVAAMLATACTLTDSTNPNGFIDFFLGPSSASVTAGGTTSVPIQINRNGGFKGPVTVTATGLPPGVTAAAVTIPANQGSGTLVIVATPFAAAGTSNVTVQASGAGITTKSATLSLSVQQAPGFTLSLASPTVSVQEGSTATEAVSLVRVGGFSAPISLTATGLPAGLTVTADSPAYNGTSATLRLSAITNVPTASGSVTITASSQGASPSVALLGVQMLPPPASSRVNFIICGQLPTAVAVKDGTGPFEPITSSNNTFTFNITSPNGAIAWVTGNATAGFNTSVLQATAQELTTLGQPTGQCPSSTSSGKTVSGSVLGLGPTDQALVELGGVTATVPGSGNGTFTAHGVLDGVWDAVVQRISRQLVNQMVVRRNQNPADGSTLPPFDLNSSSAFAPANAQITITGLGSDQAITVPSLYTANGSLLTLGGTALPSASSTVTIPVLPQTQLLQGDLMQVQVTTTTSTNSVRIGGGFFADPNGASIDLGPALAPPAVSTLALTPNARLRLSTQLPSLYRSAYFASFSQPGHTITIFMTPGYAAGASTLNVDTPDFSGLPGWNAYGLSAGVNTGYVFTADDWLLAAVATFAPRTNGSTYRQATVTGQYKP